MSQQQTKKQRINVGSIRVSKKDPSRYYLKVTNSVDLKEGENLFLETPTDCIASVRYAVEQGWMNEERAAELEEGYSKTPEWVKYFVRLTREG